MNILHYLIVAMMIGMVSACSAIPRAKAVPQADTAKAVVEGMQNIRYIVGHQEDMKRLAQDMADKFRSDGKIYVVIAIASIILIGIFTYLFMLDRKITKIEKELNNKNKNS